MHHTPPNLLLAVLILLALGVVIAGAATGPNKLGWVAIVFGTFAFLLALLGGVHIWLGV